MIWGAHATRVLVSAARGNLLQSRVSPVKKSSLGESPRQHASRVRSPEDARRSP